MRFILVVAAALLLANLSCNQSRPPVKPGPNAANHQEKHAKSGKDGKASFVSLFDGKSLDRWQGDVAHYKIEDGTLVCHGEKIFTKKQYSNFVLRFDFRLPPGANNGVGIRTPMQGDPAYAGMEIQILDDGHPKYKEMKPPLQPYQAHGSIYGVVPAKRGFLKPTGQWNSEEIVADGSHIKVTLNGTVITDADLSKVKKTMDGHEHPGLHNAKGYLGLLGHGADPVAFRNIEIKELP
ncbi:MAG: DUF1080 domain-containing protein [Thermoguttaceae bacterium]